MKQQRLFAIRAHRGTGHTGRHVLHLRLRGGAKGTGREVAYHTCMADAKSYKAAVWEIAGVARETHGIDASCILNLGPYPV